MTQDTSRLTFPNSQRVHLGRISDPVDLPALLTTLELPLSGPVLVVVGGAAGLPTALEPDSPIRVLFRTLASIAEALGAPVIDGGTDSGIMALNGQARLEIGGTYPLVGVAASGTIDLSKTLDQGSDGPDRYPLEPRHSHFVLVPGNQWGDESPWIARVATCLAGSQPSATVLVNGGDISRSDIKLSLQAERPVLVIAGTGRLADEMAESAEHPPNVSVVQLSAGREAIKAQLEALLTAK